MITIGNETFYIDVDVLNDELNNDPALDAGFIEETFTTTIKEGDEVVSVTLVENKTHKAKEVDGFKYDLYMNMIRTIMDPIEREDPGMPMDLNSLPINFTIAWNTLLYKKILKSI